MKKILFATTALIATAGFASAEIALSGYAEIGIADRGKNYDFDPTSATYGRSADGPGIQFYNEFDLKFLYSGESDTGLSFGATIDLDEVPSQFFGGNQKSSVWISGTYGTLTMGDTDGAYDWAMIDVGRGTSLADDHTTHAGYNGNSEEGSRVIPGYNGINARYDYSFGDFGVAISAQMDSTCDVQVFPNGDCDLNKPIVSIGGIYNTDIANGSLGLGVAYSQAGSSNVWGVSGKFDINNILMNASYSAVESESLYDSFNHWAVALGYQWDALLIQANYGKYDWTSYNVSQDGWGLVANYDLGGGAIAALGYGQSSTSYVITPDFAAAPIIGVFDSESFWSAGMILNF